MQTFLALGSNMGDRLGYLSRAVTQLGPVVTGMRLSRIYESAALLPQGATPDMDRPYLNMVLAGQTELAPAALLAHAKQVEKSLGRVHRAVWGPREIDIDVLAMADTVLCSEVLTLPHPQMLRRDFVMLPLCDVAPDWVHPLSHRSVQLLCAEAGFSLGRGLKDSGFTLHAH
jgi:2-amino-4-hydroxy-6-hydroxymethyldihydropteridine diphosphokinase